MSIPTGAPTAPVSRLSRTVRVSGTISSGEDLHIDGVVDGDIEAPSHCVTLGADSRVNGTMFARDVTLAGSMDGKITAVEIVDIRATAHVTGEIVTPGVIVAEGAFVRGRIETKRSDAAVRVARYRMERRDQP